MAIDRAEIERGRTGVNSWNRKSRLVRTRGDCESVRVIYGVPHWLLSIVLWMGALVCCPGQSGLPESLKQSGLPDPPQFGVQDRNGVFRKNSEAMRRIADRIRDLAVSHGFQIYVVVEPLLLAGSADETAAELQQVWLRQRDGMVVVLECDIRNAGFGPTFQAVDTSENLFHGVPTHEKIAIIRKALETTDRSLAPEVYAETLVGNLVDGFDQYFEREAEPVPRARKLRFGLMIAGLVSILGLGAIAVGALSRLRSVAGVQSYRFPVVDRPERLGAPSGGGQVTSRRFKFGSEG